MEEFILSYVAEKCMSVAEDVAMGSWSVKLRE